MKLTAVHHVALIVSDYDKSRDFYVNKLGFEVIRENHRPERHDYKLDLKCGSIELEILVISYLIQNMLLRQNVLVNLSITWKLAGFDT